MNYKINDRIIGPGHPPYIVAEMSGNHNGSLERAIETIDVAHHCGADAIKLQTYTADTITIDSDKSEFMIKGGLWDGYKLYDLYKWAETPFEWHKPLFEHAHERGITIFSTPFDETAVDLLEELNAPAYKIASFELVDLPLIRYIASTRKPLVISTGMASEQEIEEAVTTARQAGCRDLILLHCISSYPTPVDQANLKQIQVLAKRFEVLSGLSDHTMGTSVPVTAVGQGAHFIEKHFTISRSDKGPDSEFSLEPDELRRLCLETKEAWSAIGKEGFERQIVEEDNKSFRRSLFVVKDMEKGDLLTPENLRRIRPGHGLPPKHYEKLLGKSVTCDISKGTPMKWEYLNIK